MPTVQDPILSSLHDPDQNHLLAALTPAEREYFSRHLELVSLTQDEVIADAGAAMPYVYFPTTAIFSLFYVMEDGASAEIAIVGNEGLAGVPIFMGGETTTTQVVVHSTGCAYRLKRQRLKDALIQGGELQRVLLRYTQVLLTQMAQTAVCNRHHSIDQQLCRWLLVSFDSLPTNQLIMTQDRLASLLGVRRESVTEAAGKLKRDGLIHYDRGRISVINRTELKARACECYAVVKNEVDRLLLDTKR